MIRAFDAVEIQSIELIGASLEELLGSQVLQCVDDDIAPGSVNFGRSICA